MSDKSNFALECMRLAVLEARKNIKQKHGGPFGACVVKGSKILSISRNTVIKDNNPTSHAEINAIKSACKKLKTYDLSGCVIYSTTEPCPMCFSAIHWARIGSIFYGTGIKDVKKLGFHEMPVSNFFLKKISGSKVKIKKGFLLKSCRQLLSDWYSAGIRIVY